MLEEIIKVCRDDVLTIRIYQYMADRLFKCPETESKYKSVKEFWVTDFGPGEEITYCFLLEVNIK